HVRRKAKAEEAAPGRPFRTRIVHPQR
ncbi:MAG: hypothetical protein QOJ26_1833, partial [Thermoplasmata archaeon]|nr:hypothetical protein [Thermoplasmata archaeon]